MTNVVKIDSGDDSRDIPNKNVLFEYIRLPEFKRLLNQIVHAQANQKFKSCAVLSEFPGEGKSFFVSVLALGYASFLRKRVLIMDTISQTRNDSLYSERLLGRGQFGMNGEFSGSIDLITSNGLRQQIQQHCERLDPSFEDQGFDTADFQIGPFVDLIKDAYDLILLDTCAMRGATKNHLDPIILAKQANTSILITSQASLEQKIVRGINDKLKWSHVQLLGTIFNSGAQHG